MSKKITLTIAKILAEKVREKIALESRKIAEKIKQEGLQSKNYKKYCTLDDKIRKLIAERTKVQKNFENEMSTKIAQVTIQNYNGSIAIMVREQNNCSIEGIKNEILLNEYFRENEETLEELVQKIANKFLNN